jgi:glycosyltransferase involved in cell wall biosynthesis
MRIFGAEIVPGYEDVLQRQAKALRLEGVEFLGPVHGDAKRLALQAADVYVQPSRSEGFPNSLIEALGSGVPAVVTAVGAMPEIVEAAPDGPACGLTAAPEDATSLTAALKVIFCDAILRREMGIAARRRIEERYALDQVLGRFRQLYLELANAPRVSGAADV